MKLTRLIRTAAFSLLLGATALVCTQGSYAQDQQQDARPEANKPAPDNAKSPRQDQAKPAEQNENKPTKQNDDKTVKQEHSGQSAQNAPHAADHNAANRSSRIPDDKFRASFGRQHTFVVQRTTVVEGQPRFQYGGYSFTLVDAWPVGWAYTDQCYIDYIDGEYFLFDLAHPGVRIALVVLM